MENTAKEIGQKLKTARSAKNITQQHICDVTGISPSYYSRIESGKINASLDKYAKILKVLGLTFDDIIQI